MPPLSDTDIRVKTKVKPSTIQQAPYIECSIYGASFALVVIGKWYYFLVGSNSNNIIASISSNVVLVADVTVMPY